MTGSGWMAVADGPHFVTCIMPRYLLAPHSYVCEVGGYGVFLDLKHDKYTAVTPEDMLTLRTSVEGWVGGQRGCTNDDASTLLEGSVIDTLLQEGLLTGDRSSGRPATPPRLEEPTISTWEFPRPWPLITTRDLRNFIWSWATTTLRLRAIPIRYVINRLRKGEFYQRRRSASFDIENARRLTAIHFALQPAFYSAKDACLRNSLTLLEFLATYDVYPTCVFGVTIEPFAAHAWLQHGPVVLTDPVDDVNRFTPIMVV